MFLDTLKSNCQPKELDGKVLNAQMFLGLAMDFCEAVNNEDVPMIESSVSRLVSEETRVIEDDCYFELKNNLDEDLSMETTSEAQLQSITNRNKHHIIRKFQQSLSRFLSFPEIILQTKKFKARIKPMIERYNDYNYVQGFHFSRELMNQMVE